MNLTPSFEVLTINPIITENFHSADDDVPPEILEIIDKFLELEDTGTYSESSKDKMYEQILKASIEKQKSANRRDEVIKWCKEYVEDV